MRRSWYSRCLQIWGRLRHSYRSMNIVILRHRPINLEDTSTVILTFSDGTKATVIATDTLLGGSKNYVELYCNDAAITCNSDDVRSDKFYCFNEERLDDVYISEMLPSKTGWNHPFLEDEIIRGYMDEMRDFMEAIYFDHEPKSSFSLAYDTVKITASENIGGTPPGRSAGPWYLRT